jgi:hypothetical protein
MSKYVENLDQNSCLINDCGNNFLNRQKLKGEVYYHWILLATG